MPVGTPLEMLIFLRHHRAGAYNVMLEPMPPVSYVLK